MNATKHGGPAFPTHWPTATSQGATLRDYFMAHAPAEPHPWFEPVMPERPAYPELPPDLTAEEKEDYRSYNDCFTDPSMPRLIAFEDQKKQAQKAGAAWDRECEKQRYIQWPRAWADAMLEEREKGGVQ